MEEKKVPPVKKPKTTSTKKAVTTPKAVVKKHMKCKLYLVPNHKNLYYYFEENSNEPKFYREVKPRKPRATKQSTGEKIENKSNEPEKKTEEKKYPLEVREKVLADRDNADKIVNGITNKEQTKPAEEKKYPLEVREKVLADRDNADKVVNSITNKEQIKPAEEKKYPLEVREKVLADRDNADKIVNGITNKEQIKPAEEKKYPLEVREKVLADRDNADKIVNGITNKEQTTEGQTNKIQTAKDTPEKANKIAETTPAPTEKKENNEQESKDNSSKPAESEKKEETKKDDAKKDDGKKDDVKKDDAPPKKKTLNVNKKLVGFLALLCATGAFFLVSPVLMFVALMLFEASLVMQSIEYNEFRPRRHPMTRREKGMSKVARLENILSKNQLTDEEINLLNRRKDKDLTPEEKKALKLAKEKQRKFNKASRQYKNSPYTSQPTEDFLKEKRLKDSLKVQNDNFGNDKTQYLNNIQTKINNRKNLLKNIKENNIQVDESQINIIKDEIKNCEDYYASIRDKVNNQEYYQNQKNLGYYQRTMDSSFLNNIEIKSTFESEVNNSKIETPKLNKNVFQSLQTAIDAQKEKQAKQKQAEKDNTNSI